MSMRSYHTNRLSPGTTVKGMVVHVGDPDNFYIQLARDQDVLTDMMSQISEAYLSSRNTKSGPWILGEPCAAQYEVDECWYRARITGTQHNQDRVEVTFVDYGNTEYIEKHKVRPLLPHFLEQPITSYHCNLDKVSSAENFWSPEYIAQFEDLVIDKEFSFVVVRYDDMQEIYTVAIFDENGVDINRQFGQMTNSLVAPPSPTMGRRIVRASEGLDMKVTVSQQPPARGIAQALGVTATTHVPKSSLPQVSLKVGENAAVRAIYVTSPSEFWCHLQRNIDAIENLGETMTVTYNEMGPADGLLLNLRPGSTCAAFSNTDSIWYRATVQSVTGPEATIFYLDYGNTETVAVSNLKELKEAFRSLPAQALQCCLAAVVTGSWSDSAAAAFEDMIFEDEFTATVVGKDNSRHLVSLVKNSDGQDVATALREHCPEAIQMELSPPSQSVAKAEYSRTNISTPSILSVYLSWVETPGEFYVQLEENTSVLDSLTSSLQQFYNTQGASATYQQPVPGAMVVAKFSEDDSWYRGTVQDVSGAQARVVFVDYGNADTVPLISLKQVDKKFLKIPMLAVRCSLAGVRPLSQGNTWGGDAKVFLEQLTEEGATCKFIENAGSFYKVELVAKGRNVARELVSLAVVRELSPEAMPKFTSYQFEQVQTGETRKVLVSYVDSVENFFVQLSDKVEAVDSLMAALQTFYDGNRGKSIRMPQVGMPCVAKYDEDGQWYRAQVRSFTARDVDVYFVDYGNTQTSPLTTIMEIDASFVKQLQGQAVSCALNLGSMRNIEALTEKFSAFTGEEELDMIVRSREGSHIIVDLLKAGASVTEHLGGSIAAVTKSMPDKLRSGYTPQVVSTGVDMLAFVSYIDNLGKFWLQLAGCEDELTSMMRSISDHYLSSAEPPLANPSSGMPCVALYEEDEQYYRALVLSVHGTQVKVQFVDYGNAELVDRNNIKPILSTYLAPPLLAIEVCLDGFQDCSATDDLLQAFETLVLEQELSVTFKDAKNVAIKLGDQDIAQALRDQGFSLQGQKQSPKPLTSSTKVQSPQGRSDFRAANPRSPTPALKYQESSPPSGSAGAIITHLDKDSGHFYVQLLSSQSQLEQLASRLQAVYQTNGPDFQGTVAKDSVCVAKFSSDNCWYRSLVQNVQGARYLVQFVDYGNSDFVTINNLKSITPDLIEVSKQVFLCKLKGLQTWNARMADAFSKTLDEQLNVRFVTSTSPYEIQASVKGQDLLQLLLKSPSTPPKAGLGAPRGSDFGSPGKKDRPSSRDGGFGSPYGEKGFGSRNERNFNDRGSRRGGERSERFGGRGDKGDSQDSDRGFGERKTSDQSYQNRGTPKKGFEGGSDRKFGSKPNDSFGSDRQKGFNRASAEEDWGESSTNNANPASLSSNSATTSPAKQATAYPDQVFQPQQIPGVEEAAYVSHISENGTFYLQLVKDVDIISEMSDKVASAPTGVHPNSLPGAACGAIFSEDQSWYRGLITSVQGSTAEVLFVDFGNSDKCEVGSLKPLPAGLLTPALAYHCQVEGTGLLTPEQVQAFKTASMDQEYQVTFCAGTPFTVAIKDNSGVNLATTLFLPTTIRIPAAPSEMVAATVSHVGEDGHFYLHLKSQEDALYSLSDELQAIGETGENHNCFEPDQICCAKFSEDSCWYRAKIVSATEDCVVVHFVDYGNTQEEPKENLKVLPPSFFVHPAFAFDCQLRCVKKWKEEQKQKFITMTDGKTMNATFYTTVAPFVVELTLNISLELLEDTFPEEESSENVTESEQLGPENAVTESDLLSPENAITESGLLSPENAITESEQFSSENAADESEQVLQEDTEKISEENDVKELMQLPEKDNANSSLENAFNKSEPVPQEDENLFLGKDENGSEQLPQEDNANLSSENAVIEPDQETQKDITNMVSTAVIHKTPENPPATFPYQIPPSLDACIVSFVDVDGIFYIQLTTDDENREALSDKLQDECTAADSSIPEAQVGLACCAKFSEDEAWYRAVIEKVESDGVEVRFVDFGNTDYIPVTNLRALTVESLSLPPLAYCCLLEDCDGSVVSSRLEEVALDQTLSVTFQSTEKPPFVVNLQLENGTDVCTLLTAGDSSATELKGGDSEDMVQEEEEVCEVAFDSGDRNESVFVTDRNCIELCMGHRQQVKVSLVVSPSLFYVQRDKTLLSELTDALLEHFSNLAEGDGLAPIAAVGHLCAVEFEGADGETSWCRAQVTGVDTDQDTCELFYVDFGNSGSVPRSLLRELPAEHRGLPWQCTACCLSGVRCQGEDWSEEACAVLEEIIANKSLLADVLSGNGLTTPYLVNLLDLGISVAETLLSRGLPDVEAGTVTTLDWLHIKIASSSDHDQSQSLIANMETLVVEEVVQENELDKENKLDKENELDKEKVENSEKETVDELSENELEFSRKLQACTAQMESTLLDDTLTAWQKGEPVSTIGEEPPAIEENEEEFQDAVEQTYGSDLDYPDVDEEEEIQTVYSNVAESLPELEWIDVHVCVAISASEFWCQLPVAGSVLLGSSLGIQKSHSTKTVKDLKVGNLYLVCDPPQANFRGKVLSTEREDEGKVTVLKLDYGTEEDVPKTCLYPLTRPQLELPAQAFCCCLDTGESVTCGKEWLDNLITSGEAVDTQLQVKVVGRLPCGTILVDVRVKPSPYAIPGATLAPAEDEESPVEAEGTTLPLAECEDSSVEAEGTTLPLAECEDSSVEAETVQKIVNSGEVSMDNFEISQPMLQSTILGDTFSQSRFDKSDDDTDFINIILDHGKDYEVTILPEGKPDLFYVTLNSAKRLLSALEDDIAGEMEDTGSSASNTEALVPYAPCLVLAGSDNKWQRGIIKSSNEDGFMVRCVDTGALVTIEGDQVRELPLRLLDTAAQAVPCCLADITPVEDQWCDTSVATFREYAHENEHLKMTVMGMAASGSLYKVSLCIVDTPSGGEATVNQLGGEKSINRNLVEMGYAEAIAGSPLDLELQVERTINEPGRMEELELSFTEVSCKRENSFGDDNDTKDAPEQEKDIDASGDATKAFSTESDDEPCQLYSEHSGNASGYSADVSDQRGYTGAKLCQQTSIVKQLQLVNLHTLNAGDTSLQISNDMVTSDFANISGSACCDSNNGDIVNDSVNYTLSIVNASVDDKFVLSEDRLSDAAENSEMLDVASKVLDSFGESATVLVEWLAEDEEEACGDKERIVEQMLTCLPENGKMSEAREARELECRDALTEYIPCPSGEMQTCSIQEIFTESENCTVENSSAANFENQTGYVIAGEIIQGDDFGMSAGSFLTEQSDNEEKNTRKEGPPFDLASDCCQIDAYIGTENTELYSDPVFYYCPAAASSPGNGYGASDQFQHTIIIAVKDEVDNCLEVQGLGIAEDQRNCLDSKEVSSSELSPEKQHLVSPGMPGECLDPQLTAAEIEQVAEQLQQMALQEMQKHEQEEARDLGRELSRMLDDYSDTFDLQGDGSPTVDMNDCRIDVGSSPSSLPSQQLEEDETPFSSSQFDASQLGQEEPVLFAGEMVQVYYTEAEAPTCMAENTVEVLEHETHPLQSLTSFTICNGASQGIPETEGCLQSICNTGNSFGNKALQEISETGCLKSLGNKASLEISETEGCLQSIGSEALQEISETERLQSIGNEASQEISETEGSLQSIGNEAVQEVSETGHIQSSGNEAVQEVSETGHLQSIGNEAVQEVLETGHLQSSGNEASQKISETEGSPQFIGNEASQEISETEGSPQPIGNEAVQEVLETGHLQSSGNEASQKISETEESPQSIGNEASQEISETEGSLQSIGNEAVQEISETEHLQSIGNEAVQEVLETGHLQSSGNEASQKISETEGSPQSIGNEASQEISEAGCLQSIGNEALQEISETEGHLQSIGNEASQEISETGRLQLSGNEALQKISETEKRLQSSGNEASQEILKTGHLQYIDNADSQEISETEGPLQSIGNEASQEISETGHLQSSGNEASQISETEGSLQSSGNEASQEISETGHFESSGNEASQEISETRYPQSIGNEASQEISETGHLQSIGNEVSEEISETEGRLQSFGNEASQEISEIGRLQSSGNEALPENSETEKRLQSIGNEALQEISETGHLRSLGNEASQEISETGHLQSSGNEASQEISETEVCLQSIGNEASQEISETGHLQSSGNEASQEISETGHLQSIGNEASQEISETGHLQSNGNEASQEISETEGHLQSIGNAASQEISEMERQSISYEASQEISDTEGCQQPDVLQGNSRPRKASYSEVLQGTFSSDGTAVSPDNTTVSSDGTTDSPDNHVTALSPEDTVDVASATLFVDNGTALALNASTVQAAT